MRDHLPYDRILVADDHEPWQRLIAAALQKDGRWRCIETASDGLEAVRQAEALQPNLILMDVELPRLGGVEAARRILAPNRDARILFVSTHRSIDIVETAMGAGARGYVVKPEAGHDLQRAIDLTMQGSRFLSPVLYGRAADSGQNRLARRHEVGFFSEEPGLVDAYASFAAGALSAGESAAVIARTNRLAAIRERLMKAGLDVDLAEAQHRYRPVGVDGVLDAFMRDGAPDEALFWKMATTFVMRTAAEAPKRPLHIAACGECAGVLLENGRVEAAIQVEHWCSQMVAAFGLDVFCGYCTSAPHTDDPAARHRIEQEHTAVCSG
jgi:DNA-binding NarL/FixJ family response regulator